MHGATIRFIVALFFQRHAAWLNICLVTAVFTLTTPQGTLFRLVYNQYYNATEARWSICVWV